MPKIFNAANVQFHYKQSPVPEFSWHTSQSLSSEANADKLIFDIRLLDPDKYSYPYHSHRHAEEMIVILEGCAMLRTPEGMEEVRQGDTVYFESGPSGAHQLYNHTERPCRYLDIRTFDGLDVCDYPDSGKVNILPDKQVYYEADQVDYFDGERHVRGIWSDKVD